MENIKHWLRAPQTRSLVIAGLFIAVWLMIYSWNAPLTHNDMNEWTPAKLTRAADRGDTIAQMALGLLYQTGENGFSENHDRAYSYYKMAADAGVAEAAWNAAMLAQERGDAKAVVKYLYAAHLGGIRQASVKLGKILVIEGDVKAARPMLELAAASKNAEAMTVLGGLWQKNYPDAGIQKNDEKTFFWTFLAFHYETDTDNRWNLQPQIAKMSSKLSADQLKRVTTDLNRYMHEVLHERETLDPAAAS
jgi:TPR repeat protein